MTPQTWTAIGEVVGAAVIVGGVVLAALRASLGKSFVTHAEHDELGGRMTHAEKRLGSLETTHAALDGRLGGIQDSVKAIERQNTLILQHLLRTDQKEAT